LKNQTITAVLFVIIIFIFISFFTIQNVILNSTKEINKHLNLIINHAEEKKWEEARESLDTLNAIWDKQKFFLAINYAEADYSIFIDNLARIDGAIKTQDSVEAICQAEANLKLWENFRKIIPNP
jgi:hypothetical protein